MKLSKLYLELQRKAIRDPKLVIEHFFYIVNKQQKKVPFMLNATQKKYYDEMTWRDKIVKARKEGMSSLIEAIFTVDFLFKPNSYSVVISHETQATEKLLAKVKYYIETRDAPEMIPVELTVSRSGELYNKVTNSRFYIGTAGARAFGRGEDIHNLHLSEAAHYQNWRMVTGVVEAVPQENKNTRIIFETTANGRDNFYQFYWDENGYKRHFYGWQDSDEYRLEPPKDFMLTEEEEILKRKYNLDNSQLYWRRQKIQSIVPLEGHSKEETFKQEYPVNAKEAFLFTGNPYFDPEAIDFYFEQAKPPILRGNLVGVPPNQTFSENSNGFVRIWEVPEHRGQYIVAADTASLGTDFCAAVALNRKTWEMVAKWHGRINAGQFGDELNLLGRYYNNALLAVEANNMGQSTIDRLKTLNYPYLYLRERFSEVEKKVTKEVGWWTDRKTKPLMLGYLAELIRTRQIPSLPDEETLRELSSFTRKPNGRLEAAEGSHDDMVIALAIAFFVLKENPYVEKKPLTGKHGNAARRLVAFRRKKKRFKIR